MARVTVVGAGVVGLSCAVRLLEAGHRVDVVARDLPLETTSAVAAAIWYPYRALPQGRVTAWARSTYAALEAIADTEPDAGVRMVDGTEVHRRPPPEPWWAEAVPGLARETTLPAGYGGGWSFRAPVADMSVYLPWLARRVSDLGGTLTRLTLSCLPPARAEGADGPDLVVSCAGLGSRLLAGDRSVAPVRGQVVHLRHPDRPGGLDRWCIDPAGPTYVVPRSDVVVVGGTADEGDWSRTPSPATAEELVRRGRALVPELAGCAVVRHRVGLRPVRPAVRVERVGDVVHCYGHGGAGVTLAWGTADEVVATLAQD